MHLSAVFLALKDYMLPCFSKQLFGVECPGCGLQRAVLLLFQGEFLAAFKMYPAIYPITALFGFLLADYFFKIKYANKIVIALMIGSVLFILTNFFTKFL